MPAEKLAGKASYLSLNGTRIPIKRYVPKTTRKLADTTDSDNYDATADLLFKSQVPVMASMDLTVDGNFDLNTTPQTIIALLFSGTKAVPVVLGLDAGTLYGHGNFDIADFTTTVPVDDTVTYGCSLHLNGTFYPGA